MNLLEILKIRLPRKVAFELARVYKTEMIRDSIFGAIRTYLCPSLESLQQHCSPGRRESLNHRSAKISALMNCDFNPWPLNPRAFVLEEMRTRVY